METIILAVLLINLIYIAVSDITLRKRIRELSSQLDELEASWAGAALVKDTADPPPDAASVQARWG